MRANCKRLLHFLLAGCWGSGLIALDVGLEVVEAYNARIL